MTKCWLFIFADLESAKTVVANGRTGFRSSAGARHVTPGDRIAFYLTTRSLGKRGQRDGPLVFATGTATSNLEPISVEIQGVRYPQSCSFTVEQQCELDDAVHFRSLVPDLTFLTNKSSWQFHVMGTVKELPEGDFDLIERALKGS